MFNIIKNFNIYLKACFEIAVNLKFRLLFYLKGFDRTSYINFETVIF